MFFIIITKMIISNYKKKLEIIKECEPCNPISCGGGFPEAPNQFP